jgi:pimeloyl-ACP methyl ester carboxylesterase
MTAAGPIVSASWTARARTLALGACVAAAAAGMPAGRAAAAAPDYARAPVLFVHGHGMDGSSFEPLMQHLAGTGYPRAFLAAPAIPSMEVGNQRAAETAIAHAVERLLAAASAAARAAGRADLVHAKIDIVAHSMGALSSRWYATKVRPDRVRTWIALAGANHGTTALCPFRDLGARDSCPAFARSPRLNPLQAALNGGHDAPADESPFGLGRDAARVASVRPTPERGIAYYTVRLDPDEWIRPANSALLDGSGGLILDGRIARALVETSPGNFLYDFARGADLGHDSMLGHPDIHRFVAAVLRARRPGAQLGRRR